jgi:hypothetical protein
MKQETKVVYALAITLALLSGTLSLAVMAKSDNAPSGNATKSDNAQEQKVQTQNKGEASAIKVNNANSAAVATGKSKTSVAELTDYVKPDQAKGETNAKVHTEKTQEVTKNLQKAANSEKAVGNVKVSNQIRSVATQQVQTQAQTSEAIEEVETRSKVKSFVFGEDYKNLGQLRSEIVQNRNEIRTLTKNLTQTQTKEGKALSTDLETLLEEQARLKAVVATREGNFSLFGWLSRWMSGYEAPEADDAVDDQLAIDAQAAIDAATVPADTTAPSAPGTGVPTVPATPVTDVTTPTTPVTDATVPAVPAP